MGTAEQLALSLRNEGHGVHLLLWDDKEDLIHALLILTAAIGDVPWQPILVPTVESDVRLWSRQLCEKTSRERVLWVFVPQASATIVGPWLNGLRRPLSQQPGTLIVVRTADFAGLRTYAPDLTSFVGPRIFDASTMLSLVSVETYPRMHPELSGEITEILRALPGSHPIDGRIRDWYQQIKPTESA
jgi:hypothetical protein